MDEIMGVPERAVEPQGGMPDFVSPVEDSSEEERIYKTFIQTFRYISKEDKMLADAIVKYILSQLNSSSLRGYIYFNDYQTLLITAIKGLFKLIYLEHYSQDLIKRDILFSASKNFIILLYSRVYEGKDYTAFLKEIESKRALVVSK